MKGRRTHEEAFTHFILIHHLLGDKTPTIWKERREVRSAKTEKNESKFGAYQRRVKMIDRAMELEDTQMKNNTKWGQKEKSIFKYGLEIRKPFVFILDQAVGA
ncbi:hypothetical protein KY284_026588 [Solanum tuberosum]|nr:hypothetical protein KY284_026588 [Solanum tuberosum]